MRRFWYITVIIALLEPGFWFIDHKGLWPAHMEGWTWFFYFLPVLLWLLFLLWASSAVCSGIYLPAFCRGRRDTRGVALSFDDGPDPDKLPAILELLEQHGFKASFFFVGSRAVDHGELVGEVNRRGHLVGNHSWSHSWRFPMKPGAEIADELRRCNSLLEESGAGKPVWFRPPFGVSNPRVYRGWKDSGMKVAGWSIRSYDSKGEKARVVVRRILRRLRGGDVILLHENSPHILEILELLLPVLVEKGLSGLSLDELYEAGLPETRHPQTSR